MVHILCSGEVGSLRDLLKMVSNNSVRILFNTNGKIFVISFHTSLDQIGRKQHKNLWKHKMYEVCRALYNAGSKSRNWNAKFPIMFSHSSETFLYKLWQEINKRKLRSTATNIYSKLIFFRFTQRVD